MPHPNREIAIHLSEILKHLHLFHFSQNEPLISFSYVCILFLNTNKPVRRLGF